MGGLLCFGVAPSGKILGQEVSDRTLEEVARIEPAVLPSIEKVPVAEGRFVVAITVPGGPNRPCSYKGQAYKRLGSSSRKRDREEFNRMLLERFHGERRWETEPLAGWSVADLDADEIVRTVDEAVRRGRLSDPETRNPEELLRGLGLTRDGQLVRAAAVLFGKRARLEAEFPQCTLRVARFRGTDKSEFIDNRHFQGHAFRLLQQA